MKMTGRIRLFLGILFVVAIVGLLTIKLNNTLSVAHSSKAELNADVSTIGTDYPGLIVKQYVEEGDTVKKDQTLFEIQSTILNEALANNSVSAASLPVSLNALNKNILLKAAADGVIRTINYKIGSYAPAGGIIANINTVESLYVIANFRLSPPDYARITKDSTVDIRLPDNSSLRAKTFSIALVRNGDNVDTLVKARIKNADVSDFRFSIGTPVTATLRLRQTAWYQPLYDYVKKLFNPSGR
jgi:multidrug resistance efflux pump